MDTTIRPVREDDADPIVDLLNPIIMAGGYTIMAGPLSVEEQIEFIRGFPERGVYHVAISDEVVVGIQDVAPISADVGAFGHVGEISTFVALNAGRRGIGSALCRATFRAAREQGFRKLRATIRADNPGAIAFYLSRGFEVIGIAREHAFIDGRYVDEVLAERFLD